MFTKMNFIRFARMVNDLRGTLTETQRQTLAREFMDMGEESNPRFDRDKFWEACNFKD